MLAAALVLLTVTATRAQDRPAAAGTTQDPTPSAGLTGDRVRELRSALDATAEQLDATAVAAARDQLTAAERDVAEAARVQQRRNTLVEKLSGATDRLQTIEVLKQQAPPQPYVPRLIDLDAYQARIAEVQRELQDAQQRAADAAQTKKERETRRSTQQQSLDELRARIESTRKALAAPAPADENSTLTNCRRAALTAQLELDEIREALTKVQQTNHELLQRLSDADAFEADRETKQAETLLAGLERRAEQKRKERNTDQIKHLRELRGTVAERAATELAAYLDGPALLQRLDDAMRVLAGLTSERIELQKAEGENQRLDEAEARIQEARDDARTRLEASGLSMGVGEQFRRLRAMLREERRVWEGSRPVQQDAALVAFDARFADEAELRRIDADLEASDRDRRALELDRLEQEGTALLATLARLDAIDLRREVGTAARSALESRLQIRRQRADGWSRSAERTGKLLHEIDQGLDFVTEQVLWVRDTTPIWQSAPARAADPDEGLGAVTRSLGAEFDAADLLPRLRPSILLLLAAVGLALRRFVDRRLHALADRARRRSNTSIIPTLRATIATLARPLPVPLGLVALADIALVAVPTTHRHHALAVAPFHHALTEAAVAVYALLVLRSVVRTPDGLAVAHFGWRESTAAVLRRNLGWLVPVVAVTTFSLSLVEQWDRAEPGSPASFARTVLLIATVAAVVFSGLVLHPERGMLAPEPHHAGAGVRLRRTLRNIGVAVPLLLGLLACLGFVFTARSVFAHWRSTALLIFGAVVAHELVMRWLKLTRRALALERAKDAHRAKNAPSTPDAMAGTDLEEIDQQTRVLVRFAVVGAALFIAAWIWADTLPALAVLDEFRIWPLGELPILTDENGEIIPSDPADILSVADLLGAALTIAVTWILATNIGGLLEVAVLRHLRIGAGERYAARTIVRYAVAILGMVLAFSALGLKWSSVQWLAAAVSVGLGFGLQEIFANFVSGLILLVERPIRVGDVVTVDGVDGTVSRIEMRATTITDWDRKELVVPNRDFITKQVVNWSLTNPITRLVIPIGIAYGSDTRLARDLLLKAADSCRTVLSNPKPNVVYRAFGESSLDFQLRIFIATIDDFVAAMNEIHFAIDDAFREAGIEIAFPQRDLHVRSVPLQSPLGAGLSLEPRDESAEPKTEDASEETPTEQPTGAAGEAPGDTPIGPDLPATAER